MHNITNNCTVYHRSIHIDYIILYYTLKGIINLHDYICSFPCMIFFLLLLIIIEQNTFTAVATLEGVILNAF